MDVMEHAPEYLVLKEVNQQLSFCPLEELQGPYAVLNAQQDFFQVSGLKECPSGHFNLFNRISI